MKGGRERGDAEANENPRRENGRVERRNLLREEEDVARGLYCKNRLRKFSVSKGQRRR